MNNKDLVKILNQMAQFLEIDGVAFKPYAYNRAALSLESINKDIVEIYKEGGVKALMDIPGIGKNIADHIEEYLKTGRIKHYEYYKKKFPLNVDELMNVEGLGVKKIKILYQKLGVKNLKDLKNAVKNHKIASLFGFGEKTEKNILQNLKFLEQEKGRFLISEILPIAEDVVEKLKGLKEVEQISLAGSSRRRKETIGDVDILVVAKNSSKIMDYFTKIDSVQKVWAKGATKASVRMKEGFDIDLRVVKKESYGSALQYFTGSKEHNIITRKIAIEKGLKLSEYGVFRDKKRVAGKTEEEVYNVLGLSYIEPELRENQGEIEFAKNNEPPKIIDYKDIKGDLHCHTIASDGKNSIEEIAKEAKELGYEYIGISDHTGSLAIANGLKEKKLLIQNKQIKKINEKFKASGSKFRVLHGCEANILNDGSIDIKDNVLEKLDYVIASVHSNMKMNKKEMTERIIKAMRNKNVNIIGHPTGRIIGRRDEYQVDFDDILEIAKKTGTILEINSSSRMDLKDLYIRKTKNKGVKMIINTDSHQKNQLKLIKYGIFQARRGWAEKKDIINTLSVEDLLKYFKKISQ